jgi:N-methylhydantoinase B
MNAPIKNTLVQAPDFDILQIELFRHAMLSIADELEVNLTRTAYSLLIYEYKDYCIGFLDAGFRLIAQSKGSLPIFVSDLGGPVRDAVDVIGVESLAPGDIFLTNYTPVSGQHLNNVVVATPIFDEAHAILGYICVRAHWADVGGLAPGSISWEARDIFQEGIQYRGLRIVRGGIPCPEVLKTIEANTRQPKQVMGDLNAQLGACQLGLRRWSDRVSGKWSADEIRGLMSSLLESSAELARRKIRHLLPNGRYESDCWLDDAGPTSREPILLKLAIDVQDGNVTVDMTGMPDQTTSPMNAGEAAGVSCVRVAFKALLDPEIPVNEGFFDPIQCVFRKGTIISAEPTAPLGYWNAAIATIIDLVFKAIGSKCPEVVPAGHHASFGIFMFFGKNEDASWWMFMDTAHGGRGAHAKGNGFSPLKTLGHGDTRDIPVEVMESRFPLVCHSYRFVRDSGGKGLYRGGDATERIIEIKAPEVMAEFSLDRTFDPPWGIAGGSAGEAGDIEVCFAGSNEWQSFKKAGALKLGRGTLVRIRSNAGGGWGEPAEDSPCGAQ